MQDISEIDPSMTQNQTREDLEYLFNKIDGLDKSDQALAELMI